MSAGARVPEELRREMGCSIAEFDRWLPGAARGARIEHDGGLRSVHTAEGTVEIALTELPVRRIALLAVPVLAVHFRFVDMTPEARAAFLTYFDHYTRRGGG